MDVSVLIPGIRLQFWPQVYKSLEKSFSGTWEIVFVGPYTPEEVLQQFTDVHLFDSLNPPDNVKFIHSYASPLVCRQQSLITAKGDYICYAADDVLFCDKSIDEAFVTLAGKSPMDLVVGKYLEGTGSQHPDNQVMRGDPYWYLNSHGFLHSTMARFPKNYFLINTGLIPRKLMIDIGGWDCQFEACAMGCVDLSLRLQIYGAQCHLQHNPIFFSSHIHGEAGDHKPIHDGQTNHDMPLFLKIWERPEALNRTTIELENWRHYPSRWERRFGKVAV